MPFIKGQLPWNTGTKGLCKTNSGSFKIGSKLSEETKQRMSITRKRLGTKPPSALGRIVSQETRDKIGLAHIKENPSYHTIHAYIRKKLGSPVQCKHCPFQSISNRKVQWANISGTYKRDLTDWIRLCVPCHRKYDNNKRILCK